MRYRYLIPPIGLPFFFALFLVFLLFFTLFSSIVTVAFQRLDIPPAVAYILFLISLFGSFVNIPIAEERLHVPVVKVREVRFFGISYPVPYFELEEQKVIIAVNVGGALVPLSVVLYEVVRLFSLGQRGVLVSLILAILISAVISYILSKPVQGVGIAIPTFIPPLVAVSLALLFGGNYRPLIAYASGTMGVLIGADLMNWGKLKHLEAPMVSIGGAGTFDGIFLAGVIAVLLV